MIEGWVRGGGGATPLQLLCAEKWRGEMWRGNPPPLHFARQMNVDGLLVRYTLSVIIVILFFHGGAQRCNSKALMTSRGPTGISFSRHISMTLSTPAAAPLEYRRV